MTWQRRHLTATRLRVPFHTCVLFGFSPGSPSSSYRPTPVSEVSWRLLIGLLPLLHLQTSHTTKDCRSAPPQKQLLGTGVVISHCVVSIKHQMWSFQVHCEASETASSLQEAKVSVPLTRIFRAKTESRFNGSALKG